ncbi:MAG: hypothetical protein QXG01_00765, partial [Candidatus Bathyarchaeia archaeon]
MEFHKIKEVRSYIEKMKEIVGGVKYKIIIVKDSYFFFVNESFVDKYYEGGHKGIEGWYSGILSFKKEGSEFLYIFISEALHDRLETKDLFLKILYQIVMYLNPDFLKLKHKKFRKRLRSYLLKIIPEELGFGFDATRIDSLLNSREDSFLFEKTKIVIPHMSLYGLIEKLPSFDETIYIDDVKSYLQPFEYMSSSLSGSHYHHSHNH